MRASNTQLESFGITGICDTELDVILSTNCRARTVYCFLYRNNEQILKYVVLVLRNQTLIRKCSNILVFTAEVESRKEKEWFNEIKTEKPCI